MAKKRVTLSFIFEGDDQSDDYKEVMMDAEAVTSPGAIKEMNEETKSLVISSEYKVEDV